MSTTTHRIKEASQKYAFVLRLIEEARLTSDRERAILLYNMAKAECETLVNALRGIVNGTPTRTLPRRHAA